MSILQQPFDAADGWVVARIVRGPLRRSTEHVDSARNNDATPAWQRLLRRVAHPGVSGRVLGTMLLPLLLLSILSVSITVQRHSEARAAESVAEDAENLGDLLDLRAAVFAERMAEEITLPERRPPAELESRSTFLRDVVDSGRRLVSLTDEALLALAPSIRPFHLEELTAVRESIGSPNTSDLIEQRWAPIERRLGNRIDTVLARLRMTAAVELFDPGLARTTDAMGSALEVPMASAKLIGALSNLWAAPAADRAQLQSEFAAAQERFDGLSGALDRSTEPELRALWDRIGLAPEALRRGTWLGLAGQLSAPSVPTDTQVLVGMGLLDGIDWAAQMNQVSDLAVDLELAQAGVVEETALRQERLTALLTLSAIAASIGAAMLFGRSIVAPVRRLTDQAIQVGRGDLSVEPLELSGPPEVERASAAFNDVVDNLVLLECKTRSLASCDFDDPSLAEPLPGELGASLQRSVRVLSGSIIERQRLQERLAHQASHDALTGLTNRAGLISQLFDAHQARRSAVEHSEMAILFVDLDGFKRTNDRYGHAVGDELLKVIAKRLASNVRDDVVVARLGGDEFVVLLTSVDGPQEPVAVARRLVAVVLEPIDVDGLRLQVGACIGVALTGSGRGDDDPTDLLRCADLAVYAAKGRPGEHVTLYDDEMDRLVTDQEEIEVGLTAALSSSDELRLVYQPVIDSATGVPIGFEALVRWRRDHRGDVSPAVFVPVAERTALVVDLDLWVLERGVESLAAWSRIEGGPLAGLGLSVNVSGRSLVNPDYVTNACRVIRDGGIEPGMLTLEVTETALVTDLELAAEQLRRLRATGARIAIDDFGTGYTSVAHLRAMPVDEIKIDSSFVHGLPDPEQHDLIQMINELAHRLGVPTVAEGVETTEQFDELVAIGCDWVQGYLFAAPMEQDELSSWANELRRGRPALSAALTRAAPR